MLIYFIIPLWRILKIIIKLFLVLLKFTFVIIVATFCLIMNYKWLLGNFKHHWLWGDLFLFSSFADREKMIQKEYKVINYLFNHSIAI